MSRSATRHRAWQPENGGAAAGQGRVWVFDAAVSIAVRVLREHALDDANVIGPAADGLATPRWPRKRVPVESGCP
jgi:hypothetical protein